MDTKKHVQTFHFSPVVISYILPFRALRIIPLFLDSVLSQSSKSQVVVTEC